MNDPWGPGCQNNSCLDPAAEAQAQAYCPGAFGITPTPTPTPPPQAYGYSGMVCNTLSPYVNGWTCDPNNFSTALSVNLYLDGSYYTTLTAGDYRSDVAAANVCGGTGNHGFGIAIPQAYLNGGQHRLTAIANGYYGQVQLQPGAPDGQQGGNAPYCMNATPYGYDAAYCGQTYGNYYGGWTCIQQDTSNTRLAVNIYVDGAYYTTVSANQPYDNANSLAAGGWCQDNYHAFSVGLPVTINDGNQHTIQGYVNNPNGNPAAVWLTQAAPAGQQGSHTPVCPNLNTWGYDGATCAPNATQTGGWACIPGDTTNTRLVVAVYIDGAYYTSVTANQNYDPNNSLVNGGWCKDNYHAYALALPQSLNDGTQHTIQGYAYNPIMNTWTALSPGWASAHTPVCQNMNPIGSHDASSCQTSVGWACDPDNYAAPIRVDLYANGPAGAGGTYIGSTNTGVPRPDVPQAGLCGGNQNTGWSFNTPSSFYDGTHHPIYAYAINIGQGASNPPLSGTPKDLYCPLNSISGTVYVDTHNFGVRDADEVPYNGTITISSTTSKPVSYPSNGTYSIANVLPGDYYVTLSVPSSYYATSTITRFVHVANSSVSGIDFGISNAKAWWQTSGLDIRDDSGIASYIPPSPAACVTQYLSNKNSSGTPGVVFSGVTDPNLNGNGSVSTTGWEIGSLSNPETFKISHGGRLQTSYTSLLNVYKQTSNGNQPSLLPGCNSGVACSTPAAFTGSGVYRVDGNLTISSSQTMSGVFVVFVNGDVTITGTGTTIHTSPGNNFVLIASGNIKVNGSVGTDVSAGCTAFQGGSSKTTPGQGDLEGLYSADKQIILNSQAFCQSGTSDNMLFLQGSFISNAGQQSGSKSFVNNRSLCAANLSYPTFTIVDRPDLILNYPDLLKSQNVTYQETAP